MRLPRFYFRLLTTFIGRFRILIFVSIPAGILIFVIFTYILMPRFSRQNERIGVVGKYSLETLPQNVLELVGNGLTQLDPSGKAIPALAESWESSDSGRKWSFKIDRNKFWQDETVVDSQSLNYRFSDLSIDRPDLDTIVFNLKDKFAPFPVLVSQPVFKKGLVGTGEWRVQTIKVSGSYLQELSLVDHQKNQRSFKFYPTEDLAILAFRLGEIDKISDLTNADFLAKWPTVSVLPQIKEDKVAVVFFNTQDALLSDKSLRQALTYAIDKNALSSARALGPISPTSWAYNPQVKPYDFDLARAKKLLEDLPKDIRSNLEIKLTSTPNLLGIAEKITKNWEEIGVKSIVSVSNAVPQEFQAYLTILDIPADPDQYAIWHSSRDAAGFTHYKNPRIDKLLEDGRMELNSEDRKKIYFDFQRFLIEDSPAAFLYHPTFYQISRK